MSIDPLDPEDVDDGEDVGADFPYCTAVNGLGSHNFQPIQDLAGSGIWLWCTQCGDYLPIEGTGLPQQQQQQQQPPPQPQPTSSGSPLGRITLP